MSDRGIFYCTAPDASYTERLLDIIIGKGALYGAPMRLADGTVEYGVEIHMHSELKAVFDHLKANNFSLGGGARP